MKGGEMMAKRYLLILGLIALLIPLIAFPALGAVPQLINFQGRMTDAAGIHWKATTNLSFIFMIS